MTNWLLVVMVIVALRQPTIARAQAAIIFAFVTAAHSLLLTDIPGFWYYLAAAATDLVILNALSLLSEPTLLTIRLMQLSVVSMLLNAVGWVFYMLYLPPIGYDLLFVAVYTVGILVMLRKDDVGVYPMDRRYPDIRRHSDAGGLHPQ